VARLFFHRALRRASAARSSIFQIMKRTHFHLQGVARPLPAPAPDMTREKAARILRGWRSAVRSGNANFCRCINRGVVRAYVVAWPSNETSGLYVTDEQPTQQLRLESADPDLSDPFVREARFNLEAA
jgi:hypothetical protein